MCKIPHLSKKKKKKMHVYNFALFQNSIYSTKSYNCAVCVGGVEMITEKNMAVNITG